MLQSFAEDGFSVCPQSIEPALLDCLENTIKALFREAVSRLQSDQPDQGHVFDMPEDTWLHEGMIRLYQRDSRLFQYVVDAACNSTALYRLVTADCVLERVRTVTNVETLNDINMTQARLRVDLPSRFKANRQKMHLGYHQESGYFSVNLSQSTGVVGWIPLFDCGDREGALRILPKSHEHGPLQHVFWFEDEKNKRQKRATVDESVTSRYVDVPLESRRGDLTFQNFHLIHRSGDNETNDRVRYTVVVRYSNHLAQDFHPISWTV